MNLGLEQDCGRGENEKKGSEESKCRMVWQVARWELREKRLDGSLRRYMGV